MHRLALKAVAWFVVVGLLAGITIGCEKKGGVKPGEPQTPDQVQAMMKSKGKMGAPTTTMKKGGGDAAEKASGKE